MTRGNRCPSCGWTVGDGCVCGKTEAAASKERDRARAFRVAANVARATAARKEQREQRFALLDGILSGALVGALAAWRWEAAAVVAALAVIVPSMTAIFRSLPWVVLNVVLTTAATVFPPAWFAVLALWLWFFVRKVRFWLRHFALIAWSLLAYAALAWIVFQGREAVAFVAPRLFLGADAWLSANGWAFYAALAALGALASVAFYAGARAGGFRPREAQRVAALAPLMVAMVVLPFLELPFDLVPHGGLGDHTGPTDAFAPDIPATLAADVPVPIVPDHAALVPDVPLAPPLGHISPPELVTAHAAPLELRPGIIGGAAAAHHATAAGSPQYGVPAPVTLHAQDPASLAPQYAVSHVGAMDTVVTPDAHIDATLHHVGDRTYVFDDTSHPELSTGSFGGNPVVYDATGTMRFQVLQQGPTEVIADVGTGKWLYRLEHFAGRLQVKDIQTNRVMSTVDENMPLAAIVRTLPKAMG